MSKREQKGEDERIKMRILETSLREEWERMKEHEYRFEQFWVLFHEFCREYDAGEEQPVAALGRSSFNCANEGDTALMQEQLEAVARRVRRDELRWGASPPKGGVYPPKPEASAAPPPPSNYERYIVSLIK